MTATNICLFGRVLRAVCHAALVSFSLAAAILLRFDFEVPGGVVPLLAQGLVIALLVKTPVFLWAGLDCGLHRFAGVPDLFRVAAGNLAASAISSAVILLWIGPFFPRSVFLIDLLLCFVLTCLVRFSARIYSEVAPWRRASKKRKRILIYGAGGAGAALLRDIRMNHQLSYEVLGFLDDDPYKKGALVMGARVLGYGREAPAIADRLNKSGRRIDEIVIAIPSATGRQMREALANCRAARIPCKTIPGLGEVLSGQVSRTQIRSLSLPDLLGRKPVELDEAPIRSSIEDRCILVTGAAGSIGSELCRQIARFGPATLVALDQAESELFKIDSELREKYPDLDLVPAIGDIRDPSRLSEVIERFSVESIFHAAAYKHVPMMERHVLEAVRNNIIGTWNLLQAVRRHRVARFMMISSDKAVNPSSVMGATKRICELMVSAMPLDAGWHSSKCVSVRFGNVLGSNGSVIPTFQAQIAAGGPVTVTHPEMRRYFMTIAEAVLLVLQASTMGKGSEIFVLDMGEPVRILDLALNMIRLAGLEPYEDIDIQFTGLRPGEKLYEETNLPDEDLLQTHHGKIRIFRQSPPDWSAISAWLTGLELLLAQRGERELIAHIKRLVPEYRPSTHRSQDKLQSAAHKPALLPVGAGQTI